MWPGQVKVTVLNPGSLHSLAVNRAQSQQLGPLGDAARCTGAGVGGPSGTLMTLVPLLGFPPSRSRGWTGGWGGQPVDVRPESKKRAWPAGGGGLAGRPAAPRNLSAMQPSLAVFIYAERIFISAPFSLIGQEMAGIVTYLAAQGSRPAKTHRPGCPGVVSRAPSSVPDPLLIPSSRPRPTQGMAKPWEPLRAA